MLSPIFTSSKQHVIAVRGKLLDSKKCFGTNNNTWTLQQANNEQQEVLQQCSKLTLTHVILEKSHYKHFTAQTLTTKFRKLIEYVELDTRSW